MIATKARGLSSILGSLMAEGTNLCKLSSVVLLLLYCYLSVAVIKPLDQGHLQKKQFIWAKVLEGPSQHGGRKQRDHICKHKCKQNSGRRKQLVG